MRRRAPLLALDIATTLRGRGPFRATIRHIAARLQESGDTSLYSSVAGSNRTSLRAHAAAGFEVVRRSFDVRVLGGSVRARRAGCCAG